MISSSLAVALMAALAQTPAQPASPAAQKPAAPAVQAATPVAAPPNPFLNVLPNLGRDLQSLASEDTAIVMGVGTAATIASHNNDVPIHNWVLKQPEVPGLAHFGNFAGDAIVQAGLAVGAWAAGRQTQDVRLETTGADLVRAQILNAILTVPIKYIANRQRPDGGSRSFPSGHTSATFATAAVVQRDYGLTASIPFYALGGLVSWSRVRTNHHWLSDDLFGAALGITAGLAVTTGRTNHWSIAPVKTAGGAAIYVIRR
jgi:membrane-associated phospholipid phosphatase